MKATSAKIYCFSLLVIIAFGFSSFKQSTVFFSVDNRPVEKINLEKFQGEWYSLTSIPTFLDKKWRQTIENYTLKSDHFDVLTTYHKIGNPEQQSIKSKLFFYPDKAAGEMKAQFVWPVKVGYRIIELPEDYSYVVIGHPNLKYLFIMSRKPLLGKELMDQIIKRCAERGYAVTKLVSQEH
ncbi:lipocalin family protein [Pedobacter sandarakinus]|uniref:lipocalin family protein n=1 Tax=Pedobacter sandarakinus TaxID=353156 RepID=UPI002246FC74|nr:lipocalin family protein [Pedobacter sandarakinus]MCX2575529.1 lipocalin family protein [Pedobacter sandarakinus]